MELRHLRYFVAAAEAGSLLKASARLHVAQPALGQQITTLEHHLGVPLFHRSSRGLALTEAGTLFLDHARLILADVERARLAVQEAFLVPQGEVSLGLTHTIALGATMPILAACREQLPRVRLKIVEAYSGFLRERLVSGRLDIALLYDDTSETRLATRPLLDDALVLVTKASASLPARLTLEALTDWPLILPGREHGLRRLIDDACDARGAALEPVAEIESLGAVKLAVETGLGSTILPLVSVAEEVKAGRLATIRIDDPHMKRRVVLATHPARPPTFAATAVAGLLHDVIREMVATGAWPGQWVGGG